MQFLNALLIADLCQKDVVLLRRSVRTFPALNDLICFQVFGSKATNSTGEAITDVNIQSYQKHMSIGLQ